MDLQTEHWFPTTIWTTILDDIDNSKLKSLALDTMKKDKGVVKSNRNGWQSDGMDPGKHHEFGKLMDSITHKVNTASHQVGMGQVNLSNVWINVNGKGGYNQMHTHIRSMFSGVYYVSAKHGQGGFYFERNDGAEHFIKNPDADCLTPFNVYSWVHPSETGKLIIFPSWLKHSVEPNDIDEYRISISFNYQFPTGTKML
ncbi:MAG: hypothetical protein CMQ75_04975 [Gammaproteobacteria bacterium]|nr:hypothetical protein [Gammaproteobacteria bacterium]|tara:strand:- start:4332 stop:4928 length:597 start_codon:yes stop_codon:yes gene_type:complete